MLLSRELELEQNREPAFNFILHLMQVFQKQNVTSSCKFNVCCALVFLLAKRDFQEYFLKTLSMYVLAILGLALPCHQHQPPPPLLPLFSTQVKLARVKVCVHLYASSFCYIANAMLEWKGS